MIHRNIRVRRVENKIVHFKQCLVSGVRFNNVAEMIKCGGGMLWHIERKNHPFAIHTEHGSEHGSMMSSLIASP